MNGPDIIDNPQGFIEAMADGFIEAAIWADLDYGDGGELGRRESDFRDASDLAPESRVKVIVYVDAFATECVDELAAAAELDTRPGPSAELLGHDLYLTGAGHGTGFWDRDFGPVGDSLSEACKYDAESAHPYVGDDGRIYLDI